MIKAKKMKNHSSLLSNFSSIFFILIVKAAAADERSAIKKLSCCQALNQNFPVNAHWDILEPRLFCGRYGPQNTGMWGNFSAYLALMCVCFLHNSRRNIYRKKKVYDVRCTHEFKDSRFSQSHFFVPTHLKQIFKAHCMELYNEWLMGAESIM